MATPQYENSSPYFTTTLNSQYLDILSVRPVSSEVDDFLYTIEPQYTYRPDLLANDIYGDSKLWWVFAVRNKSIIKDPIYDLQAGIGIYIPQISTLSYFINAAIAITTSFLIYVNFKNKNN
jgi:hypothetical protein